MGHDIPVGVMLVSSPTLSSTCIDILRRLPISHIDLQSDYEIRKAELQFHAAITAVRNQGLGSHTNHFLAGVAFALQSPHRGPRVLNALRSDFGRNAVTEKICLRVLDSIDKVGNPPVEEVVEEESCDEEEECCQVNTDDNFCSKCGTEL